jgi:hypothetical protein
MLTVGEDAQHVQLENIIGNLLCMRTPMKISVKIVLLHIHILYLHLLLAVHLQTVILVGICLAHRV